MSEPSKIFEPHTIKNVTFKNRLIRSSLGGRISYYDGTVTEAWKRFERRCAESGVAALVSGTVTVDDKRWSPLEFPKISDDRFIKPMREGVAAVQALGCRYIMQIGDPGYQTQTSLFSESADQMTASAGFDLQYGYRNQRSAMSGAEIETVVEQFARGARRVKEIGCDGVEVTASKGYLIHQFLNPATNHRTDAYGGSPEKRFKLLADIVRAVRNAVGEDFLFGIRLSANDYNYLPLLNFRLPLARPIRDHLFGNDLDRMLEYGRQLKLLGVDYLHISNGFGFINPKENPGDFPSAEFRIFANSTRHLSAKAYMRAVLSELVPDFLLNIGWGYKPRANLADAVAFRREVGLPVIVNGAFQKRSDVEIALSDECDAVSFARPLLANPDLPKLYAEGKEEPEKPCTFCNRCTIRAGTSPIGCYEPKRFGSQEEMERQILEWSAYRIGE